MDIEVLVKNAQLGNDDAFYELISSRKSLFYKTAFLYLKNKQDCLDVIQETVCKAYISINKLREPSKFYSWFTKILINNCNDYLKKYKSSIALDETIAIDINSSTVCSEDLLDLHNSIHKLNGKHKTIIILKYFHGMTLTEISAILNCPIGTVKTSLHKALQQLKLFLKED